MCRRLRGVSLGEFGTEGSGGTRYNLGHYTPKVGLEFLVGTIYHLSSVQTLYSSICFRWNNLLDLLFSSVCRSPSPDSAWLSVVLVLRLRSGPPFSPNSVNNTCPEITDSTEVVSTNRIGNRPYSVLPLSAKFSSVVRMYWTFVVCVYVCVCVQNF